MTFRQAAAKPCSGCELSRCPDVAFLRSGMGQNLAEGRPLAQNAQLRRRGNQFKARITAPAAISTPPATVARVIRSPRNMDAKTITKTTLSLSTGATREA